jgi:hypothetical protein
VSAWRNARNCGVAPSGGKPSDRETQKPSVCRVAGNGGELADLGYDVISDGSWLFLFHTQEESLDIVGLTNTAIYGISVRSRIFALASSLTTLARHRAVLRWSAARLARPSLLRTFLPMPAMSSAW